MKNTIRLAALLIFGIISPSLNATASAPGPRWGHVFVYDQARDEIVLFGGRYYKGEEQLPLSDMWEWYGKEWREID